MKLLGRNIETNQAVVQIRIEAGRWVDYASIKDEADCRTAEHMADDHDHRIVMLAEYEGVLRQFKYESGCWEVRIGDYWVNAIGGEV